MIIRTMEEPRLKVIMLGDSYVGKTSLIERFTRGRFRSDSTGDIGCKFNKKRVVVDGQGVILEIWDTAGQEHTADGCLFCVRRIASVDVSLPQVMASEGPMRVCGGGEQNRPGGDGHGDD